MAEDIGGLYVKIKADLTDLENEVKRLKERLNKVGKTPTVDFNTTLAKKRIDELIVLRNKLQQTLEKKIAMNADLASLNRTRNALNGVNNALNGIEISSQRAENKLVKFIKQAGTGLGIVFLLSKLKELGQTILNNASEFETLRARLVALYQDTDKASEVFDKFRKIASTTPFSLKEVVEAGATLKAFGLNAEETLKSVTDLAAYMGINVVEAASAVGRAFAGGVGAADILRERGVLNLIKSFKGIDDLTKLTLPEFRQALLDTMVAPTAGIANSTNLLSNTWAGAVSNMKDAWETFTASLLKTSGIRNVVSQVTQLLTALTPTEDVLEKTRDKAFQLNYEFNNLSSTYFRLRNQTNLTKEEQKLFKDTIDKLNKDFPNYFKNYDLYKGRIEDIRVAFDNARISLDAFINSMMTQSIIEQNKKRISELGTELGKYTYILDALKTAQEEVSKTGTDPFAKLTTSQRKLLQEQGDILFQFRTANIFTPLEDQIKEVENIINRLTGESNNINTTIQKMIDGMSKALPPKNPVKELENQSKNTTQTIEGLTSELNSIDFKPLQDNIIETENQIRNLTIQLNRLTERKKLGELNTSQIDADITNTQNQINSLNDKLNELTKQKELGINVNIDTDITNTQNQINSLNEKLKSLSKNTQVKVGFDTKKTDTSINQIKSQIDSLTKKLNTLTKEAQVKIGFDKRFLEQAIKDLTTQINIEPLKVPIELEYKDVPEKPEIEPSKLQPYIDMLGEGGPFSGENGFVNQVEIAMETARGFVDGFFEDMVISSENANSLLEKGFVNMANAFIREVQRMIAEWLAFQAIKGFLSFILPGVGSAVASIPAPSGAAEGGSFVGTDNGVKKLAYGGSFIVPPGYINDNYPLFVKSGERVDVTPTTRVNQLEQTIGNINNQISVLNQNMINLLIAQQTKKQEPIPLYGQIEDKDIYISNKRYGKIYQRMR